MQCTGLTYNYIINFYFFDRFSTLNEVPPNKYSSLAAQLEIKEDGLNNILEVMDIDSVDDTLYPNTKFINVKMK